MNCGSAYTWIYKECLRVLLEYSPGQLHTVTGDSFDSKYICKKGKFSFCQVTGFQWCSCTKISSFTTVNSRQGLGTYI
jgi:hypothetical protein